MTTVAQALAQAKEAGVDRLDAQILLARTLARPRTWLLAHDEALLTARQVQRAESDLRRRAGGEPLAYIVGEKEFHGLLLNIDARVLIPRPDTEVLVDWAIELIAAAPDTPQPRIVDLGTGSGAIALSVKNVHFGAEILATDASPAALQVARANAARLALPLTFAEGSWWNAVDDDARFDLILANPPYIAGADPHLAALVHEPLQALTPGGDGLESLRHIVAGAADHMHAAAWLLLEHGHDQGGPVRALLQAAGFVNVQTRADLAGLARCTGARFGTEATQLQAPVERGERAI